MTVSFRMMQAVPGKPYRPLKLGLPPRFKMCIRDRVKKTLDGVKVLGNGELTKALTLSLIHI